MVIGCACALTQKPLLGMAVDMYTEDHTELNTPQIGQSAAIIPLVSLCVSLAYNLNSTLNLI